MSIPVRCPACEQPFEVPDDDAGRHVRCPNCQSEVRVPGIARPVGPPEGGTSAPGPGQRKRPRGELGWLMDWEKFAAGCRAVKIGLLVELLAFAYLVVLFGYTPFRQLFLGEIPRGQGVMQEYGPYTLLPYLTVLLVGSSFVTVGRFRMISVPDGTGAGGLLGVSAVLSVLRLLGLVAGVVLVVLAGVSWSGNDQRTAGLVAELSLMPGMAVVAGAMPSTRLRRTAASSTLVIQVIALLWVGLVAALYFLDVLAQWFGFQPTRSAPPRRPDLPNQAWLMTIQLGVGLVLFALMSAYTWLHYRLYAAGRKAALTGPDLPLTHT